MATEIPFVGPSYDLKVKKADVQRSVNLMPTPIESGMGKAPMFLKPVPGLTEFSGVAVQECRTLFLCHHDATPLYDEVAAANITSTYGALTTGTGKFSSAARMGFVTAAGFSRQTIAGSYTSSGEMTLEFWMSKSDGFGSEEDAGNTWGTDNVVVFSDESFVGIFAGGYTDQTFTYRHGFTISTSEENIDLYQNTWDDGDFHAIALVISGGSTAKVFLDGVLVHTTELPIDITGKTFSEIYFDRLSGGRTNVYMDEMRLSTCARYSGNYTPATEPFTLP